MTSASAQKTQRKERLPQPKPARPAWVGSQGWRILVDTTSSASEHMAIDSAIAAETIPTARFFTWKQPAVSLGLKQTPPDWVKTQAWKDSALVLVERPTGGGAAFHGSDVSIAIAVPRSFNLSLATVMQAACLSALRLCESFGVAAQVVGDVKGVSRITYCLTEASSYAVFAASKKVAGFALRRFAQTWLVEGSLLVNPLPEALARALPEPVLAQLGARAVSLAEAAKKPASEAELLARWADGWAGGWQESLLHQWTKNGTKP